MGSAYSTLVNDRSWFPILSSESKPTDVADGAICLEVDTANWYVFYSGTWHVQ